jgi:phosphodiesterase/alkaline phosphatase D-like protein
MNESLIWTRLKPLQSGIYGPDTRVTVDYHVDENSEI